MEDEYADEIALRIHSLSLMGHLIVILLKFWQDELIFNNFKFKFTWPDAMTSYQGISLFLQKLSDYK